MTYHIMIYSADRDPKVPHFLKGSLSPVQVKKYDHVTDDMLAPYWNASEGRYLFDCPLWFISREKNITLDFYPQLDGFLASDALIGVIETFEPESLRITPVTMVDEKGSPNTKKQMSFCQVIKMDTVCNLTEMDIDGTFHPEIASSNRVEWSDGHLMPVAAVRIHLKSGMADIVLAKDIPPMANVVSARLMSAITQSGQIGTHFVNIEDIVIVDFMPGQADGYYLSKPMWRERANVSRWAAHGPVDRTKFVDPAKLDIQKILADFNKSIGLT
jgi:hypothetical protein